MIMNNRILTSFGTLCVSNDSILLFSWGLLREPTIPATWQIKWVIENKSGRCPIVHTEVNSPEWYMDLVSVSFLNVHISWIAISC